MPCEFFSIQHLKYLVFRVHKIDGSLIVDPVMKQLGASITRLSLYSFITMISKEHPPKYPEFKFS